MTWGGALALAAILAPTLFVAVLELRASREIRAYCARHSCSGVRISRRKTFYAVSFAKDGRRRTGKCRYHQSELVWLSNDPASPASSDGQR